MAREHRQPVHGQVDLDGAAARLPAADIGDEVGGQLVGIEQVQERCLRVRRGDHGGRVDLRAGRERHPGRAAARVADAGHLGSGADLCPERPGRGGQRPRDAAHAATREPPRPGLTVHVADVVVQGHVGAARRPRPGPRADHSRHRQQPAQRIALEVPVEQVGDAPRQQPGQINGAPGIDLAQMPQQQPLPQQVLRPPRAEPRRDLAEHGREHTGHPGHVLLVPLIVCRVPLRELRDLREPLGRLVRQRQVPAVSPRREIRPLRIDVIPVPNQVQLAHQIRGQQRHHVRQRRHRVVRSERMLADRGPAHNLPPLAHQRAESGSGQVSRRHEAVVPPADDHDVIAAGHQTESLLILRYRAEPT